MKIRTRLMISNNINMIFNFLSENGVLMQNNNNMGATSNVNSARLAALQDRKKSIENALSKKEKELRELCLQVSLNLYSIAFLQLYFILICTAIVQYISMMSFLYIKWIFSRIMSHIHEFQ